MKLITKLFVSVLMLTGLLYPLNSVYAVGTDGASKVIKKEEQNTSNLKEEMKYIQLNLETQSKSIISIGDTTNLGDKRFTSPGKIGDGKLEKINLDEIRDPNKIVLDPVTREPIEEKISPFVVIGEDGRSQVQNTSFMPFRALTYIEFGNLTSTWSCSGGVIGTDLVVTNAHCVEGSVLSSTVVPGINNSQWAYGHYRVTEILYPQEFDDNGESKYDYAILRVAPDSEGRHIGNRAGILSWSETGTINEGVFLRTYGYPGDKMSETGKISMWGMVGRSDAYLDPDLLFYSMDTFGGQSGSPVLNSVDVMIAVHNAGYSIGGRSINGGPKIKRDFTNLFNQMN